MGLFWWNPFTPRFLTLCFSQVLLKTSVILTLNLHLLPNTHTDRYFTNSVCKLASIEIYFPHSETNILHTIPLLWRTWGIGPDEARVQSVSMLDRFYSSPNISWTGSGPEWAVLVCKNPLPDWWNHWLYVINQDNTQLSWDYTEVCMPQT